MRIRSPRSVVAMSAAVALTVSVLVPTAAFAMGPGSSAGNCDGDCTNEEPQAQQVRARDGSNDATPSQARARDGAAPWTETQANAGRGRPAQARGGNSGGQHQGGLNGNQKQGAGRGQDDDTPRGPGNCEDCDIEMGTLTTEQTDGLAFMANEEKLAHDVYAVFAELYDQPVFGRIADSEARHTVAVDTVLERYGVANPVVSLPAGQFSDPDIATLYAELIERGSTSLEDALAVGVLIEEIDIADLEERLAGLEASAPDVSNMYSHLRTASGHHLAAFESQS